MTEWLATHGIETFPWPAHSPDLNPVEHFWKILKDDVAAMFPGLVDLWRNEDNKAYFVVCVGQAWWAIAQEKTDGLVRSLPRRSAALCQAPWLAHEILKPSQFSLY